LFSPKKNITLITVPFDFHTFCSSSNYPELLFLLQMANAEGLSARIIDHPGNLLGISPLSAMSLATWLDSFSAPVWSLQLRSYKWHLRLKISISIKCNCHLNEQTSPNDQETVSAPTQSQNFDFQIRKTSTKYLYRFRQTVVTLIWWSIFQFHWLMLRNCPRSIDISYDLHFTFNIFTLPKNKVRHINYPRSVFVDSRTTGIGIGIGIGIVWLLEDPS